MSQLPNRTRGHGRVVSGDDRRRVAVPRRSTKGPLDQDVDDPLAESTPTLNVAAPSSPRVLSPSPTRTSPLSPGRGLSETHIGLADLPEQDFSFLCDPSAYHAIPTTNVPQAFLSAPSQPSITTPLPDLLATGHYRLAALVAARNLTTTVNPNDGPAIFNLFHTRLACLCLIGEHALAAQESKVLGDLSSAFYQHPVTTAHIVPWDLRVLTVRLGALGYGDWRKGIMGYYELAREARSHILKASTPEEKSLWKARLRECGIRVANTLVEMGELESAGTHLGTLVPADAGDEPSAETREILIMEAMVWLRIGDVLAAKRCLSAANADPAATTTTAKNDLIHGALEALVHIAEGDYESAAAQWQDLHSRYPDDAMVTQNLAVCLLYTGRILEARKLLSGLVESGPPFHALVFNLATVYELTSEKSRERKFALAEGLAGRARGPSEVGWEVGNMSLKL